ncbi:hypothetical protein COU61_03350 [Candidatus Pacearchaeota archaeon CG10_big_fil_rev_8_21_14_0_10_35_13]|nr:MAG: hypothetical protein COU61_03350 [Candidatus Pacearchaeota archaeon CG10_big_fil_rev_8_21_14_0_10_35_13]
MIRFLIIGDLHGAMPRIYFKKNEFDAIIVPGDVCRDEELRKVTDVWVNSWKSGSKTLFADHERYIDKVVGRRKFNNMKKKSITEGNKILRVLDKIGKPLFFVPGNWDEANGKSRVKNLDKSGYNRRMNALEEYTTSKTPRALVKGLKNLKDVHFRSEEFNGINIIGYGISSYPERPTKKNYKNDEEKRKLKKAYKKLFSKVEGPYKNRKNKKLPTIFITHNVPNNTKLDKVMKKESPVYGKHYGSTIAREFINKHQPLLCVGSHMHEFHGMQKIGRTTVVNAGFGGKVNTLLTIDEKKGRVVSVKFTNKDKAKGINRRVGW